MKTYNHKAVWEGPVIEYRYRTENSWLDPERAVGMMTFEPAMEKEEDAIYQVFQRDKMAHTKGQQSVSDMVYEVVMARRDEATKTGWG